METLCNSLERAQKILPFYCNVLHSNHREQSLRYSILPCAKEHNFSLDSFSLLVLMELYFSKKSSLYPNPMQLWFVCLQLRGLPHFSSQTHAPFEFYQSLSSLQIEPYIKKGGEYECENEKTE